MQDHSNSIANAPESVQSGTKSSIYEMTLSDDIKAKPRQIVVLVSGVGTGTHWGVIVANTSEEQRRPPLQIVLPYKISPDATYEGLFWPRCHGYESKTYRKPLIKSLPAIQIPFANHSGVSYLTRKQLGHFLPKCNLSLMLFTMNLTCLYRMRPIQWIFSHHCGYWWLGALAPRHQ